MDMKPFGTLHTKAGHQLIYKQVVRHCLKMAGVCNSHIVYDPFGGTGTTALVAQEFGAHGVLTEIDPDYCNFIRKRLA